MNTSILDTKFEKWAAAGLTATMEEEKNNNADDRVNENATTTIDTNNDNTNHMMQDGNHCNDKQWRQQRWW